MSGTEAELDRLRDEVATLRAQVEADRTARATRTRSTITWVLTVLAAIATALALVAVWTLRTVTVTDLFVDRVGSIIEEPEVAAAVGDAAAAELAEAIELQERIAEVLPEDLAVVAGPLSSAAESYLAQGATALVETDQFQAAWDAALAAGHRITIAILTGDEDGVVQTGGGVVVLDLTPVINALLVEGSDVLSELLDADVSAPELTSDDIDAAIAALEEQLDVDLPADFGQVVLFASDDLGAAQAAYQTMRSAVWLAPLAAAVLIALAIAVSAQRMRTALAIVVGTALVLLLVAVLLQPLQATLVGAVQTVGLQNAVAAATSSVLESLLSGILLVVVLGVIAGAAFVLTGSGQTAQRGRDAVRQAPALAAQHRAWALGIGAVVALLLLAVLPGQSWGQVLVVLLLFAAYVLVVFVLRPPVDDASADDALVDDDRAVDQPENSQTPAT